MGVLSDKANVETTVFRASKAAIGFGNSVVDKGIDKVKGIMNKFKAEQKEEIVDKINNEEYK